MHPVYDLSYDSKQNMTFMDLIFSNKRLIVTEMNLKKAHRTLHNCALFNVYCSHNPGQYRHCNQHVKVIDVPQWLDVKM